MTVDINKGKISYAAPSSPYEGEYFAKLYWESITSAERTDHITRLVSPKIYLGASPYRPTLTFRLSMRPMYNTYGMYDQDTLNVYFKADENDDWGEPIAVYTNAVVPWTKKTVALPATSSYGYICFEGNARYGYGVNLDDIRVNEASFNPVILTESPLPNGHATAPYTATLAASGGTEPYIWSATGLPAGLACDTNGVITGIAPKNKGTYPFTATVTDADGNSAQGEFTVTFGGGIRINKFVGTFDVGMDWPAWTVTTNNVIKRSWIFQNGSGSRDRETPVPALSYAGGTNACLFSDSSSENLSGTLRTPMLDLDGCTNATVSFWLCKRNAGTTYKDTFTVSYRTAYNAPAVQLLTISTNVSEWAQYTLELPETTSTYFLEFAGKTKWGFGVNLDEIQLSGDYTNRELTVYQQWKQDYLSDAEYDDAADDDGDGLSTLEEFVFGADPTIADPEAALLNGYVRDDAFYVTYREGVQAREYGVVFDLQSSTNLLDAAAWSSVGMTFVNETDSNTWYQVIYTYGDGSMTTAPQRFYRLKATMPDED